MSPFTSFVAGLVVGVAIVLVAENFKPEPPNPIQAGEEVQVFFPGQTEPCALVGSKDNVAVVLRLGKETAILQVRDNDKSKLYYVSPLWVRRVDQVPKRIHPTNGL